jgi:transglutaminase-like putative cysteine protease
MKIRKKSAARFLAGLCAFVLASGFVPSAISQPAAESALTRAAQLELDGRFIDASNVLRQTLAPNPPEALAEKIRFELDRLQRIRLDFPFTQETLFARLQKSVKGLTTNEFTRWVREGRFDARAIDGQRWFMSSSVANLYFRYPQLDDRRLDGEDRAAFQKAILASCRSIKQTARREGRPYVLPKRFDVTMTVTAEAGAAPAGQVVRAWLPIPRTYPYQTDFEIIAGSPPVKEIAPADSPIRSAYLEQRASSGAPTVFKLNYRYTRSGVWFDIDPKQIAPFDGRDPAIAAFTRESPHVVFTPEMKALSKRIAGTKKNPALLAKKFYDWIGAHIHYSFAIEYSTIRNISDYCRSRGYGDCGQEALLFITLCRLNGIPARWQSGWHTFPGGKDIHDWTEIYLAPYGWVPVDPYMAVFAGHYATALTGRQRLEVRDFYFGGLDQWRIAANCDHSQTLSPAKNSFRSDDVDFQRGELECGAHNIYFNHSKYQLDVSELTAARDGAR